MRFNFSLQSLLLLTLSSRVFTAPTPVPSSGTRSEVEVLAEDAKHIAGRFVAYISEDDSRPWDDIFEEMGVGLGNTTITDRFDQGNFRVFSGEMSNHCVKRMGEMGAILDFEPELEFKILATVEQFDAPWGLQRLSASGVLPGTPSPRERELVALPAFSYVYDDGVEGEGVNVYVIDTGVK